MNHRRVGVVGLGLMGQGICASLLVHGFDVVGYDISSERRQSIQEGISDVLVDCDALSIKTWPSRFNCVDCYEAFAACDFVIESVPEKLETKQQTLECLEEVLAVDVPIATNTSALPITHLQSHCRVPHRIVGMHWAEPCHLTRFLEVIRGEQTDEVTIDKTVQLGKRLGKDPTVVRRDVPGFIVNRLAYAMYREAFWLLENEVADVETIDRAFVNAISVWANFAGPFRWMDLTGLPAYAQVMDRLFPELSCGQEAPKLIRELLEQGARGIENGQGFYEYTPEDASQWQAKWRDNVQLLKQLNKGTGVTDEE